MLFNVIGGLAWTTLFLAVGWFFGNIPIIKENFSLVIMAIAVAPSYGVRRVFASLASVSCKGPTPKGLLRNPSGCSSCSPANAWLAS